MGKSASKAKIVITHLSMASKGLHGHGDDGARFHIEVQEHADISGITLPLPPAGSLLDRIYGTIYGNCIGDAIGLLTEFWTKDLAEEQYSKYLPDLEYEHKVDDSHRSRWEVGDWTDDSDQMILIMESLLQNDGMIDPADYGRRLKQWARHGFPELGDSGGMGLGSTTSYVLRHEDYNSDPHKAAKEIWDSSGQVVAPNGAVMRTSILGILEYKSIDDVIKNTLDVCKVTHYDPRCQASCVAVTTAIALMLQQPGTELNVDDIIAKSYKYAKKYVGNKKNKEDLSNYLMVEQLSELKLDESGKIGYTYKTLGSGFWALKQNDFRSALTDIVMEAGDADTNGAVAGALLGCKLGVNRLPESWLKGLRYKNWLDEKLYKFLVKLGVDDLPDLSSLYAQDHSDAGDARSQQFPEGGEAKEHMSEPSATQHEEHTSIADQPGTGISSRQETMHGSSSQTSRNTVAALGATAPQGSQPRKSKWQ